jgi:hypothetical protein
MPKPSDQTRFVRALGEIYRDGVCTTTEMARAAGCSERHMRHVVSQCDPTQLSLEKAEQLSRWLVDTFGETRQLDGLLGMRGATHLRPEDVESDDCLLEELALVSKHMSRADDAIKDGEPETARKEVERAFEELRRAHEDARRQHT